ncbi:MAG: GIY-YIG nuclease family protein [Prolixibacteraceae bacterium]
MFYTYVLYSEKFDIIYIGYTSDIQNRMIAHNHPKNKGWTKSFMPWKLIYSEIYSCKSIAMKREKELKTARGRLFIRNEILSK